MASAAGDTAPPVNAPVGSEDTAAGKLLSLKLSLHREGSRAIPRGRVEVPAWARRRKPGFRAKPFMFAAGLALLLAGGYWTLTREREAASPATPRSESAALERTAAPQPTGQRGQEQPPGPGEVSPPPTASEPPAAQITAPPQAAGLPTASPAAPLPAPAAEPANPALEPAPAASEVAPQPEAVGATGNISVQLATVFSKRAVPYEWHRLQKLLPDLLGSREPVVTRTTRGGQTRWLLRTSGFDSDAQAAAFCRRVHAKGFHCALATAD